MTTRAIAFVAGSAAVVLAAGAVRLAAADPLAAPEQSAAAPPAAASQESAAAAPHAAGPAGRWTTRKQTGVTAGVLVRAASRKPLDRGPACEPGEAARAAEEPPASRCPPEGAHGVTIEIDWHGERAAP
jgi:hypothetical protein